MRSLIGLLCAILSWSGITTTAGAQNIEDDVCIYVSGLVFDTAGAAVVGATVQELSLDPADAVHGCAVNNGNLATTTTHAGGRFVIYMTGPNAPLQVNLVPVRVRVSMTGHLPTEQTVLACTFNLSLGGSYCPSEYQTATAITLFKSASTWTDPGCEEDANPLLATSTCEQPSSLPQPPPDPLDCSGALFCLKTTEELEQLGYPVDRMRARDAEIAALVGLWWEIPFDDHACYYAGCYDGVDPGYIGVPQPPPQYYIDSFLEFVLEPTPQGGCTGYVANGRCGYLDHVYINYQSNNTNDCADCIRRSRFEARSGNNNPIDQCVPNRGPIAWLEPDGSQRSYGWGAAPGPLHRLRVGQPNELQPRQVAALPLDRRLRRWGHSWCLRDPRRRRQF